MSAQPQDHYCGPTFFPRFLRKALSKHFNKSCQIHDIEYSKAELTRQEADRDFLLDMLVESEHKTKSAIFFYTAVRLLGWTRYGK